MIRKSVPALLALGKKPENIGAHTQPKRGETPHDPTHDTTADPQQAGAQLGPLDSTSRIDS